MIAEQRPVAGSATTLRARSAQAQVAAVPTPRRRTIATRGAPPLMLSRLTLMAARAQAPPVALLRGRAQAAQAVQAAPVA
jgi:hypothetical protein